MIPKEGQRLILKDGRRFIFTEVQAPDSIRGWWYKAKSEDNRTITEGNAKLRRIGTTQAWEPV